MSDFLLVYSNIENLVLRARSEITGFAIGKIFKVSRMKSDVKT
jgi:hypothetical protein